MTNLFKLPRLTAFLMIVLGLGQVAQAVLVLQMIAPVAVTGYLIALRAREAGNPEGDGPDPDAVAGLVVISTLLSVISLPLVLGFLVG